jgi:hypothetical protein
MPSALPTDLVREVRQTLADLRVTHLAATAWPVVAGDLGRLASAVQRGDDEAVRKALVPVAQATFEGKVRGRLAGANRAAAYVASTKQTSALPVVGAVSAVILIGVGYLIGGVPIAVLTAAFAAFIAAVAYAGSHSNRARVERRQALALAPTKERTEPVPLVVRDAIARIEEQLGPPKRSTPDPG